MPYMTMQHEVDPATAILAEIGDTSNVEVFNNQILVAVYIRPEKTKSGLFIPEKNRDEDRFQAKIGLVLKKGPAAFEDHAGEWFKGVTIDVNDWVIMRPSDGWSITVNGVLCRMIEDVNVKGRVDHPDRVW